MDELGTNILVILLSQLCLYHMYFSFCLFQIYQIYSMRSAEDIYKILTSYKANYVVIEDSICNEVAGIKGCRVKDLLDIANDHVSLPFHKTVSPI